MPSPFALPTLAEQFRLALLQRGGSPAYAAKMARTVLAAGDNPATFLEARSASWTKATLEDQRNRLAIFGGWLADQPDGASRAEPWRNLPCPRAGKVAQPRAAFSAEEVGRLLACPKIPPHRRAFYRVLATLGLRPVEASRIRPEHVVQQGNGWALRLPGQDQKSGREDVLAISAKEAAEIRDNLPLVRRSLSHYSGETFALDLARAGIAVKQGEAVRTLYSLRSFLISHLLREGVDLESVRQIARHRRIETTLRHYARHQEGHAGTIRAKAFRSLQPKARVQTA